MARRKRVDAIRRRRLDETAAEHLLSLADVTEGDRDTAAVPDRRLGLLFACAQPGIDRPVRAPLMLQVVLGFDAATIVSAFLVAPATMGQRLARAKARIQQAGIGFGFEVPEHSALRERLDAVLEAIYAAYAEGWSDPEGADARRHNLADEAIWVGRRDATMIDEAEALLSHASRSGGSGRFQLEAAVHSAHAVRGRTGRADWAAIEQLYDTLCTFTGSPVAGLNRAVALAQTRGAAAGLAALDSLADDARLADYQPSWAARADLLARSGDMTAALRAYHQQAIGLERDPAVRQFLQQRAAALVSPR